MPLGAARLGYWFVRPEPVVDFNIDWTTTQTNILPECGPGGWVISNYGNTIRFDFQDSQNCGGCNGLRQKGTAIATIYTGSNDYQFQPVLQGMGEREATDFEFMDLYLNSVRIVHAQAPGGGLKCAPNGPAIITPSVPPMFTLNKFTTYEFKLIVDSIDSLFHTDAYYEAVLNFYTL